MPARSDQSHIARPPAVLCIGGHDPTGGAGIIADAEAVRAAGAHALTVVTCLTGQDTCGVSTIAPQPPEQAAAQWRALLADSRVAAVKVGLIGSLPMLAAIAGLLSEHPELPTVLDPVIASGRGDPLADDALLCALREGLSGGCTLLTPNLPEARALSGRTAAGACAQALLQSGWRAVLITGTHAEDEDEDVVNRLYEQTGACQAWRWPRLPHAYHGSGCTLASAIAARLALGSALIDAVADAQAYTWQTLARARRSGRCQLTPNRLFGLEDAGEMA